MISVLAAACEGVRLRGGDDGGDGDDGDDGGARGVCAARVVRTRFCSAASGAPTPLLAAGSSPSANGGLVLAARRRRRRAVDINGVACLGVHFTTDRSPPPFSSFKRERRATRVTQASKGQDISLPTF